MSPSAIAASALEQVGTPFRLYGRSPSLALDCVGLAIHAVGYLGNEQRYHLKGDYREVICSYLDKSNLLKLDGGAVPYDGDLALVGCAPRQQHLMVRAKGGWVHAHAGLGRVVHTPGDSPWPIIAIWRASGE